MTPDEPLRMKYITCGSLELVDELNEVLGQSMDLSKIAQTILLAKNN